MSPMRWSGYELSGAQDTLAKAVPIRAGEEELSVTVQVVWSFD